MFKAKRVFFAAALLIIGSFIYFSCSNPAKNNAEKKDRPPNIVLIFTDDQGYGDVGVFGAKGFKTPNLDRMAGEGIRLTSFYVSQPVCSASRVSLMTGCYANRVGFSGALGPKSKTGLHSEETTIAELCKTKTYATAVFGKWHLGRQPQFLPTSHGFDEYYGIPYSNDMWYKHPDREEGFYPDLPLLEGETVIDPQVEPEDQQKFTKSFTERAVSFINRNKDRPFFLYLAHPMPHVPLYTASDFEGVSEQGRYGDVISEIDWSVGQVLEALKSNGIDKETLLIFTSDNGPWLAYGDHAGTTGPLRNGKGTTYEGGVRVPCIMRWPGKIPAAAVSDEPLMTIDILPTIAHLIGAELPARKIDGLNIWPLLSGEEGAKSPHDVLYFYYRKNDLEALRSGRWKLVFPHKVRTKREPQPEMHTYRNGETKVPGVEGYPFQEDYPMCDLELYDLETDISEQKNLAEERPEIVEKLIKYAEAAYEDLGDDLTGHEGSNRRRAGEL